MRTRDKPTRILTRALLAGFVLLAVAGVAAAQTAAPDMSGTWSGKWKNKSEKAKGTMEITVFQDGSTGSFTGMAWTKDLSETIEVDGTFSAEGRKFTGSMDIFITELNETVSGPLAGKCNKKATKMKFKWLDDEGSKVKIKLLREP
jgi:hypothetical protein